MCLFPVENKSSSHVTLIIETDFWAIQFVLFINLNPFTTLLTYHNNDMKRASVNAGRIFGKLAAKLRSIIMFEIDTMI